MAKLFGYAGRMLRVDLTHRTLSEEALDEQVARNYIGGAGLGLYYLYREVPPFVQWSDPENRMIITSGPLSGTRMSGSGTISVVSKGPLTGMVAATQANGFLGAFLKFCGCDGVILQGASSDWLYLHIDDDGAELRDGRSLVGLDTWELEDAIVATNPRAKYSVYGIGPAGENLVPFAAIVGDRGHVAGHNGVGAVLGSKKLKAIAVARGSREVKVYDRQTLSAVSRSSFEHVKETDHRKIIYEWGTAGNVSSNYRAGRLPVKNYTTSIYPECERVDAHYTRVHFEHKKTPCWACQVCCCRMTTVTEGPYSGYVGEEPEYEGYAACGPLIGETDPGAMVMLGNLVDRLGLDINEAGLVMSFAIECYERGLLSKADTGGLDLRWGSAEACAELLRRVAARREGLGELLAGGVRAAAARLGGEALQIGIYTMKGNSPRGHDHRAWWSELLDTCTGDAGTITSSAGSANAKQLGVPVVEDNFSWQQVAAFNAGINGWRQWTDSLGACNFTFAHSTDEVAAYNAATGRNLTLAEAHQIGRHLVNIMRVYNFRCGLTADVEVPSLRYSSAPVDGPAAGRSIREHWDELRAGFYRLCGWDEQTGKPKPETLIALGLEHLVADLAEVR